SAVETPTEAQATNPTSFSVILWPKSALNCLPNNPLMIAPRSGARTINLSIVVSGQWAVASGQWRQTAHRPPTNAPRPLKFKQIRVVHVERFSAAEERDDDRQPDGGLGRGHGHHDEDEQLSRDVIVQTRKRDQGQIDRIEHQLYAHKQRDDVALDEHTDNADGE